MAKKKKRSISLRPVVDAIEETIKKLTTAKKKKKTSAADKKVLSLKIKLIRKLRSNALAGCGELDLFRPPKMGQKQKR